LRPSFARYLWDTILGGPGPGPDSRREAGDQPGQIPGAHVEIFPPGLELIRFIHELFKKDDNAMIYLIKLKSPKKQSVFCTGWKACATRFFAVWRIIRAKGIPGPPD
jgi:hypothetical protein